MSWLALFLGGLIAVQGPAFAAPVVPILDHTTYCALTDGNDLYLLRRDGPRWLRFAFDDPIKRLEVSTLGRSDAPEATLRVNGEEAMFSPFKELLYFPGSEAVVRGRGPSRMVLEVTRSRVRQDSWDLSRESNRTLIQHYSLSDQVLYKYSLEF